MFRPGALGVVGLAAVALSVGAGAQIITENGDAPNSIPGQTTTGSGPLLGIRGAIQNPDFDADVYCIRIVNPQAFSATTVGSQAVDLSLWLFDANSNGVAHDGADDGSSGPNFNYQASLSNAFVGPAGTYYIAISRGGIDALNGTNEIWLDNPTVEQPPNGPGAPGPLTGWSFPGYGSPGTYQIRLTGCEYCAPPPPPPSDCSVCCGAAPRFTGFTSTVAIITQEANQNVAPGLFDHVVDIIDLANANSAPIGANWCAAPFYNTTPAQDWTKATLGTVFATTLDDSGNIYLAHTSIYRSPIAPFFPDTIGTLPGSTSGSIYKINTNTGVASHFVALPNFLESNPAAKFVTVPPASELYPGLGDICYDCNTRNLYVSNFEDGRIYRINLAGAIQSTFDHATGAITPWSGSAPEPNDPRGWVPLGERVWAVQASNGRLYYSIWWEDLDRGPGGPPWTNRPAPNYANSNEIWSIGLTPTGEFSGAPQLEITLPPLPEFAPLLVSNPVASISFQGECCMLVAERSMYDDSTSGSHRSRVMKFCRDAAAGWTRSPEVYDVGSLSNNLANSSAGGVDYNFDTATNSQAQVWCSADAIKAPPDPVDCGGGQWLYGVIGLPEAGGSPLVNGILIDTDQNTVSHDKYQQGDVEISCAPRCMRIEDLRVLCEIDDGGLTGNYNVSFTLTNLSGVTAQYLLIPGTNVTPNVVVLPPLLNGQSTTINLVVTAQPGELVCLPISLADETLNVCCADELCFTVPECDCVQFPRCQTSCMDPASGSFTLTFTIQNLTTDPVANLFALPPVGSGVTVTPSWFAVTPIANQFDIRGPYVVTISGATPGQTLCLRVSIHDAALNECCSEQKCIEVPAPCPPIVVPGDMNCDGLVNNFDIDPFVLAISDPAAYAAQYPDCNILNGDINGDGVVNNFDIDPFVVLISGG